MSIFALYWHLFGMILVSHKPGFVQRFDVLLENFAGLGSRSVKARLAGARLECNFFTGNEPLVSKQDRHTRGLKSNGVG